MADHQEEIYVTNTYPDLTDHFLSGTFVENIRARRSSGMEIRRSRLQLLYLASDYR